MQGLFATNIMNQAIACPSNDELGLVVQVMMKIMG
jgi:hypothetical protein